MEAIKRGGLPAAGSMTQRDLLRMERGKDELADLERRIAKIKAEQVVTQPGTPSGQQLPKLPPPTVKADKFDQLLERLEKRLDRLERKNKKRANPTNPKRERSPPSLTLRADNEKTSQSASYPRF